MKSMKLKKKLSFILAISMTAGTMMEAIPLSVQAADNGMQTNILSGGGTHGIVQYFLTCLHQRMRMSMT